MSLRARLLAAFAYTLIVVIVALEVPLSANVSDRVNAEVEADSAAKAQVVAASAADQLHDRASLERISRQAAVSLNGLVFVIDGSGRQIASSTGGITRPPQPTDDPVALQALGGEVAQGRHHEGRDILSTAVPIVRNGRTVGALELEQSLNAVRDQVRQDVLALIGIGVLALILGLGVAWILAGSIARPAALARRGGAPPGGRGRERQGAGARLARAGAGRARVQRDGRPARRRARIAASVRRGRLASAAYPAHGPAPAPRGRGRQDLGPCGRARSSRPRSTRPSASTSSSRTCSSSPRANSRPRMTAQTSRRRHGPPPSAGAGRRARAAMRSRSRPTATSWFEPAPANSRRSSTTWSRTRSSTRPVAHR